MKVYGLIGFPLSHSFSKEYFENKFKAENISGAAFHLYPIEDVQQLVSLVKSGENIKGIAVTIPHKKSVIPLLSSVSPEAMEIGAVNCIKVNPNEMVGYNTDVFGFEKSLLPLIKSHHSQALILGNGGAALAVKYVLKKNKIPFVTVTRNPSQAGEINYDQVTKEIIFAHTIIINTTPLGTYPKMEECPLIPYHLLGTNHLLFDLVYNPAETLFLKKGKEEGAAIKNGYEMLAIQAEENWRIWNELI